MDGGKHNTFVLTILPERAREEEGPATGDVDKRSFLSKRQSGRDCEHEANGFDEEHPRPKKSIKDVAAEDLSRTR